MADRIMHGTPAGDFHTWIDPSAGPCPNCPCCTARLCERAQRARLTCAWLVDAESFETVRDCPCTETNATPGAGTPEAAETNPNPAA